MSNKKRDSGFDCLTRSVIRASAKNSKSDVRLPFGILHSMNNMIAVYRLTASSFLRNVGAGFFTLFFPFLLILIMGGLFASPTNPINIIISGISISAITGSGFNGLSIRMAQWKQSTIIKRIGCMPMKKIDFLLGVIAFYFSLMCFQAMYVLVIGIIISQLHIVSGRFDSNHFKPSFIVLGWIMAMAFSLATGTLLSTLSSDPNTTSLFGVMIFFPSAFLSGQYIPLFQIDQHKGLKYASQIWPQRYLVYLVQTGFYNNSKIPGPSPWLYAGYPIIATILIIALATKRFRWDK